MKSRIEIINGNPTLIVDEKPTPAIAYTTYFQERNCYEEFINAGFAIKKFPKSTPNIHSIDYGHN